MHIAPVYTKQSRLQRVWSPSSHSSAMKLSTSVKQASSTTLPLHDCTVHVSRQPTPSFWTSLSMAQYYSRSFSGRTETGWVGCKLLSTDSSSGLGHQIPVSDYPGPSRYQHYLGMRHPFLPQLLLRHPHVEHQGQLSRFREHHLTLVGKLLYRGWRAGSAPPPSPHRALAFDMSIGQGLHSTSPVHFLWLPQLPPRFLLLKVSAKLLRKEARHWKSVSGALYSTS